MLVQKVNENQTKEKDKEELILHKFKSGFEWHILKHAQLVLVTFAWTLNISENDFEQQSANPYSNYNSAMYMQKLS